MADTWRFDDGTELDLGGTVRGFGMFAAALRSGLSRDPAPAVLVRPPPGGYEDLDPDDPYILDQWARGVARRHDIEVVSAPKVDPPADTRSSNAPDGALY